MPLRSSKIHLGFRHVHFRYLLRNVASLRAYRNFSWMKRIFRHRVHTYIFSFLHVLFKHIFTFNFLFINWYFRPKAQKRWDGIHSHLLHYRINTYVYPPILVESGWRVCKVKHIPILGKGISMHAFYSSKVIRRWS